MSKEMGLRVKRLRQNKGWSQVELGKRCKVSQQNIGQIEAGKPGNPACLPILATVLGVTEQYLRYGDQQSETRNGIVAIKEPQPPLAPPPEPPQNKPAWPEVALKQPRQRHPSSQNAIDELMGEIVEAKMGGVRLSQSAVKIAKYLSTLIKDEVE